ncbi:hypothetical protein SADUNF_Sadunf05G0151800 [Salix dunnii]|uniref:Uncharacterized protein n=1 Tax=Salix dunnii TaxID=1413687 RepID=A0A835K8S9_9ROSI|nr:hypothetical protein SADUNF_Sadunf05G0151800 [Salix dunnii]
MQTRSSGARRSDIPDDHSKPAWQMKTRDHRASERAMTLVNHVQVVKDVSRAQVTGPYTPFRQNEWNPSRKISSTFFSSTTKFPVVLSSISRYSPMVIVDNKKPRVFKLVIPLNQPVISHYACEQREGDDDDDDDDGVDVAPAA